MYVMFSNCRSNNLTHKNLCNKVGYLTWHMAFNYKTTNWEWRHTLRDQIPWEMELRNNSITTLYSTILFDEGQRHTPLEEKTWPVGI